MLIRWASVLILTVASSGVPVAAQYRNGQARPPSAATRPGPPKAPAGEAPLRKDTMRTPRALSPSRGLPLRPFRYPVFPLVWGWGTMPFYFDSLIGPIGLQEGPTGGVQLDVQPWRAAVFVDGVYVGRVDDFNGYYQHLEVVAGPHQIVIVEPGYQPLVIGADVVPGETITFRRALTR